MRLATRCSRFLKTCDGIARQLKAAKTAEQTKAVEKIAKATLDKLPKLAPVSKKKGPKYAAYKSISADVASLAKDKGSVSKRLAKAHDLRKEYVAAYGFVACPLCKGSGRHEGTDCPVCNGDREIEEAVRVNTEIVTEARNGIQVALQTVTDTKAKVDLSSGKIEGVL
jgi:rubrerythrin